MAIFPNSSLMHPTPRLALARWRVQIFEETLRAHRASGLRDNAEWWMREAAYTNRLGVARSLLHDLEEDTALQHL